MEDGVPGEGWAAARKSGFGHVGGRIHGAGGGAKGKAAGSDEIGTADGSGAGGQRRERAHRRNGAGGNGGGKFAGAWRRAERLSRDFAGAGSEGGCGGAGRVGTGARTAVHGR